MADAKISALTTASALAGTEVLPIVQSSTTKKVAVDDLTVKNVRSNATTGLLQITGPAAAATRTMTVPDANFTTARTDAAQTFTGVQTFTSPKILTNISDTNGNELIKFQVTSSAVNEITVKNSATGGQPAILATGGDTDVSLLLTAKGTGSVNATSVAVFDAGLRVVGPTPSFNQGAISYEYPVTRHYTGDGTGYSWAVSKRTGGATVDLLTVLDSTNNVTVNLGNLSVGGTLPTASGTGSPKILMLNDMLVISGRAAIPSPYTQNLQIDIVWGNWGGNPVLTLVDLAVAMRQYASTSGAAFGKILATNSANDAVLDTFTTTDITASRCTVTASSGGNYTLRITINPTGDTDAIGYTITIPTSSGATGSAVTSITASLV